MNAFYIQQVESLLRSEGYDLNTPVKKIPRDLLDLILYGDDEEDDKRKFTFRTKSGKKWQYEGRYRGIIPQLQRRYEETSAITSRKRSRSRFDLGLSDVQRRASQARSARGDGRRAQHRRARRRCHRTRVSSGRAQLTPRQEQIAHQIVKEVCARGSALDQRRAEYLTLSGLGHDALRRRGAAHPAGHADRLAAGRRAVRLDEPSIGLHQRDNERLLETLETAARPRQYGDRGRARRGHDPRRRLTSSTSAPAPACTAAKSCRRARSPK